ncbi:MAG: pantoate--beta-alanine ligase, partial [Chloroflexota bacterium]
MKQISTVAEMRRMLADVHGSVGLVPTMGYLHAG